MAWLWKRGTVWYVGYREGGKDRYITTGTSDESQATIEKARIELELKVHKGVLPNSELQSLKFSEVVELYEKTADLKPKTKETNKLSWAKWREFTGDAPISDATTEKVIAFRDSMVKKDYAPASVSIYLRDLNKIFGYALRKGLIKANPCKQENSNKWAVEHPEDELTWRFLTHEEEEKLLAVCSPLLRRICIVDLETGLRISQIVEMDWARYNVKTRLYTVPKQKRQKIRQIPLFDRALNSMGTPKFQGPVFSGVNKDMITKQFARAVKASKIGGKCTFHDLRHTFVSRWCGRLSPTEVRDLMGWSSLVMVDRYTHSRVTDIQAKMAKSQVVPAA